MLKYNSFPLETAKSPRKSYIASHIIGIFYEAAYKLIRGIAHKIYLKYTLTNFLSKTLNLLHSKVLKYMENLEKKSRWRAL